MTPLTAEDEPPSPGPRADGNLDASASSTPTVTAADERTEHSTPVALADLAALLSRVLAAEGAPRTAEASLTLVDADAIARLKVEHLDGDGAATDVLSFPVDGVEPDAELIGDVVLCPVVAAGQAPEHAGRLDDELALLVVHGGLHLAGWDHASEAERIAMWDRERDLLTALHRAPARDPWSESPS
jgi:probable rRNA maturation factor